MLDQLIRQIKALLDELLAEADRLSRALSALGSHPSEPTPPTSDASPSARTTVARRAATPTIINALPATPVVADAASGAESE